MIEDTFESLFFLFTSSAGLDEGDCVESERGGGR